MNDDLTIPVADIITLATEHWRLAGWLAKVQSGESTALAQRSVRQIGDVLSRLHIEAHSLDAQPFDAGLAAIVVDTIDDPAIPSGRSVVDETISPLILRKGQLLKPAEIVVRRGMR